MGLSLLDVSFVAASAIEIIIPLVLAIIIWKKYKISWSIFFLGMLFFILSLVRIPLNNLFTQFINNTGLPYSLYLTFGFASMTAALFEEGVRVLGMGLIIKNKNYYKGLMYGIGHGGGGESMIFVGFSTLANFIIIKFFPGIISGFSVEQVYNMAWFMPLIGALERVFAITVQIALSVLIMHAFLNKKYYFIAIAIIYHFIIDFVVVYLNYYYGYIVAESAGFGFAVIAIFIIFFYSPRNIAVHAARN